MIFFFPSFSAFPNVYWLEKVAKVVVFNFLNCFSIFWNFLLRVGKELIGTIFFFFCFLFSLFLGLPQHILAWKEATMVFFNFFEFFCDFFWIFYCGLGRYSLERLYLFFLFLSVSQLIFAWKEAVMLFFFNFLLLVW